MTVRVMRYLGTMKRTLLVIGALALATVAFILITTEDKSEEEVIIVEEEELPEIKYFYGFEEDAHIIAHDTILRNQFIADILLPHIDYPRMETLLANSQEHFDPRRVKVGRPYHIISRKENDSTDVPVAFIYEQDAVNYTILHMEDSLYATTGAKPIETREATASGVIESSLYLTLTQQGLSQALAMEMADIFAWTVDFYRLQKGDSFEVLYDERYIDDEFIGIGEVKACTFHHGEQTFEAYAFVQNDKRDYFDEKGEGLRKAFLQSPLKFGRLTSGYSGRRFHPVQKRFKAHKGTDYAAPTGTPIMATGDGTVIESKYRGGNGNYVKIRHNSTYSTQYLHMSKRAVNVGDVVKQGQTIGYVGSTGLASGPHVCYRFWKNGSQVNHREEEFPSTDPVLPENMERYLQEIDSLRLLLHAPSETAMR